MKVTVKITSHARGNTPGKLAEAELHFTGGELDGLRLVGFGIWEGRRGGGRSVTFPSRQYTFASDRRSFALLRPIGGDTSARTRVRLLVLDAYAEQEQNTASKATS